MATIGFPAAIRQSMMDVFATHASAMLATSQIAEQESQMAISKAAVQERDRIARELHDSVSQALFAIAMGTQTARDLLPPELTRVKEALDFVGRLIDGALAEMRSLIFELHPETLSKEGLLRALEQQVALLTRRHEMDASITASGEPQTSGD